MAEEGKLIYVGHPTCETCWQMVPLKMGCERTNCPLLWPKSGSLSLDLDAALVEAERGKAASNGDSNE